jgi:hypothetical protein
VRHRPPRILDASAIVALFEMHPTVAELLDAAERGELNGRPGGAARGA